MANPDYSVPEEFLADLQRLRNQESQGSAPEVQQADDAEVGNLNLYQVAANAHEGRDTDLMGPIQQLLVSGDFDALRARLGDQKASALRDNYLEAWQKVAEDRQATRSWPQAVGDAAVGIPASFGNALWGGETLVSGLVSPDAMAQSAQANRKFNEQYVDPLYSSGFESHRRMAAALDAGSAEEHARQAAQDIAAGGGELWTGTKRVAKDIASSALSTITDPTLLAQGTAEAAASMGEAAFVQKGLMKVGALAVERAAAQVIAKDTAAGAARSMVQAMESEAVKSLEKKLTNVAVMGATGITEGLGGYQQTVNDVLSKSPAELEKTSVPYARKVRELVAAGVPREVAEIQAKNWLAHEAGLTSAVGTGLVSAAIGHYLPEGVEDPLHVVSSGRNILEAWAKDVGKETAEEFLQGGSGQLIGNKAAQLFVNPNQDLLEGVGQQAGQGGVLGGFSAGALKGHDLFHGTASLGAEARNYFADKKIAKLEAEGQRSTDKLTAEADALSNDKDKIANFFKAATDTFSADNDIEGLKKAAPVLDKLVRTPQVSELPEILKSLPDEVQAKFAKNMNRVTAVERAAALFNEAKDPAQKKNLGVLLDELLEPVDEFRSIPPELTKLSGNADLKQTISSYQNLLSSVEALPQVEKAKKGTVELLKKHDFSAELKNQSPEIDAKSLEQMAVQHEGHAKFFRDLAEKATDPAEKEMRLKSARRYEENAQDFRSRINPVVNTADAKRLATLAKSDLSLHGSDVSSKKIEGYLAHASDGKSTLTPAQHKALATSLAFIRAREAVSKLRTKDNGEILDKVLKNHESVNRQVTFETSKGKDKISVKQYLTLIHDALSSGDTESAQLWLNRLGSLAESHNNKVNALNESFEKGINVPYQQFIPEGTGGRFMESSSHPSSRFKNAFVNSESPASIEHARIVDTENKFLTTGFNEALKAFPQLTGSPITATDLHPNLRGGTTQEAQKHAQTQAVKAKASKAAPQVETAPKGEDKRPESPPRGEVKKPPVAEKPKPAPKAEPAETKSDVGISSLFEGEEKPAPVAEAPKSYKGPALHPRPEKGLGDHYQYHSHNGTEDLYASGENGKHGGVAVNADGKIRLLNKEERASLQNSQPVPVVQPAPQVMEKPVDSVSAAPALTPLKPSEGWKIHLNVASEEATQKISEYLNSVGLGSTKETATAGQHKVGRNSGQTGKDITIYVGTKDAANALGLELESRFGNVLKNNDTGTDASGDDVPLNGSKKIMARFDVRSDKALSQYGRKSSGVLKGDLHDSTVFEKDPAKKIAAQTELNSKTEQYLVKTYGEQYTGTAAPSLAPTVEAQSAVQQQDKFVPPAPEAAAETVTQAKVPTVAERLPNLIKDPNGENHLHKSFETRDGVIRVQGNPKPLLAIYNALDNLDTIKEFLKKQDFPFKKSVTDEYRRILYPNQPGKNFGGVMLAMQKNLETAWFKDPKKDGTGGITMLEALQNGEANRLMTSQRGKVLNTVEKDPKTGKIQFNSELIQLAIMAGLQWQITASQREVPVKEDQTLKSLGINEEEYPGLGATLVASGFISRIGKGAPLAQVKAALAAEIKKFWGFKDMKGQPTGYTKGIPEAMANEVLRAMEEAGLVTVTRGSDYELHAEMRKLGYPEDKLIHQTFHRYTAVNWDEKDENGKITKESLLYSQPTLIEEMVVTEPEQVLHLTGPKDEKKPLPVKPGQLSNPRMENSKRSNIARSNMQETEFRLNRPMTDLMAPLDTPNFLRLVGGTVIGEKENYNKNHLSILESKNLSLVSSKDQFAHDYRQMSLIAEQQGIPVEQLTRRYEYVVGSNQRMMMTEAHNPQRSKFMREIMMATWSKLDLSGKGSPEAHHQYFALAIVQALGQKIHRKTFEENVQWAEQALAGTLKDKNGNLITGYRDAVEVIADYLSDVQQAKDLAKKENQPENLPQFPVQGYLDALAPTKVPSSSLVLMALTEAARIKLASPEELQSFETPLYLEADGITNGPFNAMGLLTLGNFTEDWVRNTKRGGVSFNGVKTSNQLLEESGGDLYKASVDSAQKRTTEVQTAIRAMAALPGNVGETSKQVRSVMNSLYTVLDQLTDGDVKWNGNAEQGELELERGAGKGPSTQSVYGAGTEGVTGNIASDVMKDFYAKLSEVIANPEKAKDPKFQTLMRSMAESASVQIYAFKIKEGPRKGELAFGIDDASTDTGDILNRMENAREFTFSVEETARLEGNLKHLLVEPIRQGVQETIGPTVKKAGDLLVATTGLMTNVSRIIYIREIEKKANEKIQQYVKEGMDPKKAHNRVQSEFLSKEELSDIWDRVVEIMPVVESDRQKFLVAKTALLEFWSSKNNRDELKYKYSTALNGSMETGPMEQAIDNPGVAAIPYFTIGMGDARMVREIFQSPEVQRAFQVYDGVNIPVDKIKDYGNLINKAARTAWQGNVFHGVWHTFEQFRSHKLVQDLLSDMKADPKFAEEINKQLDSRNKDQSFNFQNSLDRYSEALRWSAISVQARIIAVSKMKTSFDQMAGTFQPFVTEGRDLSGMSDKQTAEMLTEEYKAAFKALDSGAPLWTLPPVLGAKQEQPAPTTTQEPTKAPASPPVTTSAVPAVVEPPATVKPVPAVKPAPVTPAQKPVPPKPVTATLRHPSGAQVLTPQSYRNDPVVKDALSRTEMGVFKTILNSPQMAGVKVVSGTYQQHVEYQRIEGLFSLQAAMDAHADEELHGFYDPQTKTVFLIDPKAETVVHEFVHAATFQLVQAHYEGKLPAGIEKEAIQRLEGLMQEFLAQGEDGLEYDSPEAHAIRDAQAEIYKYKQLHSQDETPFQKAAQLNEFMAWSLANQKLGEVLSERKISDKLLKLTQNAWAAIKKLIFGIGRRAPDGFGRGNDMLSQIRFNTAILTQSSLTLEQQVSNLVLAHASLIGSDEADPTQLQKVLEAFGKQVARYLNQPYSKGWADDLPQNPALVRPFEIAGKLATEAASYFKLTEPLELETFRMMVMALTTEAKFNPHALTEASKIFDQFIKSSNANSFLADPNTPEGTTEAKLDESRHKFEFLTGQLTREEDESKRSSMLPVFMALGTVNKKFREYLAKRQMPQVQGQKVVGINTAIDAAGAASLKWMEETFSGQDKPENLRIALDQLTQHVTKEILAGQSMMDNALEKARSTGYGINRVLVSLMKAGGNKAFVKSEALAQSNSKLDKAMSQFLKLVTVATNEKDAAAVSEGWLSQMDKWKGLPNMMREFMGSDGLLGRQVSQAKIYDMYKKVRATVAQTRQAFREHVPFVIHSKFSETGKPTDAHYHMLYRTMGRSGLGHLFQNGRSLQQVLELAGSTDARKQEINNLESQLEAFQPRYAARYMAKIDQLVAHLHGEAHGTNLLKNAYAISELLGEKKDKNTFVTPTDSTVQAIAQLVTLKYLERMDPSEQEQFNKLVQSEPTGMEFALSYLKGTHEAEMLKAVDGMARYNHLHGSLPYESARGHLTVEPADSKTEAEMKLKGYKWMGAYNGSSIDSPGPLAYYYSPEGGARTQFNQGLIQNVQGTAYGVNIQTGLSAGPNAGYITNPVWVSKLAQQLDLEEQASKKGGIYGQENLLPIYDLSGTIVAFQRTLSPKQLAVLQQDQHLGKMIGHWRGRQMEEVQSQQINAEVVKHLGDMWRKDMKIAGEENRYENLFASNKRIIQDAVRIIPRDVREALEEEFGSGNFPVRTNLINQIVGYRSASIGDSWTGDTDLSPAVQEAVKKTLITILGTGAYRKMLWFERNVQAVTATMRTNIVVRSMTVAMANTVSGFYQLKARGVPLIAMVRGAPRKLAEIETYTRTNAEIINLEAELHAATDVTEIGAIKARIRVREDRLRNLSIWPLIEAGEFSSIADVGQTAKDFGNDDGSIVEQLEAAADKLPPGLRDVARLGYISRDTSVFQTLQKWVQYSDFVMKAIYHDHLMTHEHALLEETPGYQESLSEGVDRIFKSDENKFIAKGLVRGDPQLLRLMSDLKLVSPEEVERVELQARKATALGRITEEFNNYDLPTGRGRQYLESMGLAWFLNYKIRAAKIGLSMFRNNSLDVLLFGLMPHPMAGGIPFTDNLFARFFHGSIGHALGPGMVVQPIAWNSWWNLFAD